MNIISSGIESNNKLLEYRFKLLNTILIVATIFALQILIVGTFALKKIDLNTISLSIYGASTLGLYVYLRVKNTHFKAIAILFLLFSTIQFTSASIVVSDDYMRFSWYYLVVLVSFLLAGRIVGIVLTTVIIAIVLILYNYFETGYTTISIITTINSIAIFALISYFYIKKVENDQEELNNINQNLALKVHEEVVKNLQQAQVFEQQREKDMKFATIGQMSAGITHEINTPLTYIKGNMEILLDDIKALKDDKTRGFLTEDITNVSDGINRISSIISSMREVTSSGNKGNNFNIYSAIINSLRLTYNRSKVISHVKINNKQFLLSNKKNDSQYIIKGDQQKIEQVFIVLINNALDELIKVDDFNDRLINIDIDSDTEYITIVFADTANGIDESIIESIFDPLVSNKYEKGMGMGLSIAKKILDEHNATISVKTDHNGTQFTMKFQK